MCYSEIRRERIETGRSLGALAAEYRDCARAIGGRLSELEAKKRDSGLSGKDLDDMNLRLIKLRTIYCDTSLMARFLEDYPRGENPKSEFIGFKVSW